MRGLFGVVLLLSIVDIKSYTFPAGRSYRVQNNKCEHIKVTLKDTSLSATAVKKEKKDDNDDMSEQFQEWEAEELEDQRRDLEDVVRKARDEGTEDELPDYMMRMIAKYEDPDSDNSIPVEASKLPIIGE